MKTLLLMRHAKSSWGNAHQSDHQRPLNDRGRAAAPLMGQKLRDEGLIPDLIISSSAARAHETAELVALNSHYEHDIQVLDRLYLASADVYLSILHELGGDHQRVMLIGHNPTVEALIDHYSTRPAYITTANLGHITYDVSSWTDVTFQTEGQLVNLWRPKELD